jgi:hypothetical protein
VRTFTTEHTVYSFDELSAEVQSKVIEEFQQSEFVNGFEWLADEMQYKLEELLNQNKLKNADVNVYYSLSYCQGDGAMFEGTLQYKGWNVSIKQVGHYYHYNSKSIDIESVNTGLEAPQKIYDEFNELYIDICKKLERYGYDAIESATTEEAIKDLINSNEYEFYSNGKLA